MFEVCVSVGFTATHHLRWADGTAEHPHAHTWGVKVKYAGAALDESGLLVDFEVVRARIQELVARFEGADLNALPAFSERNPSAENVAEHLASGLPNDLPNGVRLMWVEIEEAPGCTARYRSVARAPRQ